jgi:VIT1/CCC1 family predicted Fe2+/Mn2+ transporter
MVEDPQLIEPVDDTSGQAIFGSFDGLTSVLGVIVTLLGAPLHVLLAGAIGLAASSAVGMGAGQYLGDDDRSIRKALSMAISTVVGTLIPVAPFLIFGRVAATVTAGVLVIVFGVVVSEVRRREVNCTSVRAYAETFAVLALAAGVAVVVGVLTGAA